MDESEINKLNNSSITKTHEEILEMLEEIKDLEKKYGVLDLEEPIIDNEISDFEYVRFEEVKSDIVYFKEIEEKKPSFFDRIKKFNIKTNKFKKKEETKAVQLPKNPTTFRLRLNKEGILENIDIKKPQPKKKIKLSLRKKDKKETDSSEGKSKLSKLTNGLSKIKRIIPKRGKEDSESSESESDKESE